jgi:Ca-activated chloride channel family protein
VPRNAGSAASLRGIEPLRYQSGRDRRESDELMYVSIRYKRPGESASRLIGTAVGPDDTANAGPDFLFAAAVAAWGMILRDSPHRGSADLDMVGRLAFSGLGDDAGGYRAAFLRLVDASRPLLHARIADGAR